MGTPEFAVGILDAIRRKGYDIAAVVTVPDKPAGRGQKLRESAVKTYAVSHGLPVLQPEKLKAPEFLEELRKLKADVQVVVAFRMLPKEVWNMPAMGTFNLHASLLPQYRGAAPINWAIINGETQTGVTTFFIDEKIDTGAILRKKVVDIGTDKTAGELHDTLMEAGKQVVLDTLADIAAGKAVPVPQTHSPELKTAPKLHKETCRIRWEEHAETIHNFIRGLSPYPAAWTVLEQDGQELPIKIYRATYETGKPELPPGAISVHQNVMKVATGNGYIFPLEIQPAGKRRMTIEAFLNGWTFTPGSKLR